MILFLVFIQFFSGYSLDLIDESNLIAAIEEMQQTMDQIRLSMTNVARQTISQQLFVEERIRSDGNSGLKQVRTYTHGTANYHTSAHIGRGVAAIHDHNDNVDTVGMGEAIVVLNGVEFRTRHNDYRLLMPSTKNASYGATEPVPYPKVPRSVLRKDTVEEQIEEMRLWFKAFQDQDYSVRDYREHFKPLMCYLEGAWTLDENLNEPFASDRHFLDADSWEELLQRIRYTSYTGAKDLGENFAYLPTTIMGINETTGFPIFAQWNYRILCHPISFDVPTKVFKQQDDLAFREANFITEEKLNKQRGARFRLNEQDEEQFTTYTLLDDIFAEIRGKNNFPPALNENAFPLDFYTTKYPNLTLLNTAYYHRQYKTNKRNAMGITTVKRGFSDEFLFVAETTEPRIASMDYTRCFTRKNCITGTSRFSYAIPLEVIYLTPLLRWNPYNLTYLDNQDTVTQNGNRNGGLTKQNAYKGIKSPNYYYMTPTEFYNGLSGDTNDPADTSRRGVGVLDKENKVRVVEASGTKITTYHIKDVGNVRLRYPIMPVHEEGSPVWKELNAVKARLNSTVTPNSRYVLRLQAPTDGGSHFHDFSISSQQYDDMFDNIENVTVTTELSNSHSHTLDIFYNSEKNRLQYRMCDGVSRCRDGHPRGLFTVDSPAHNTF